MRTMKGQMSDHRPNARFTIRRITPAQPRPPYDACIDWSKPPTPCERNRPPGIVDPGRVEFPHLATGYDEVTFFGSGGSIEPRDVERIARRHKPRCGKGRPDAERDALKKVAL